MYFVYDIGGTFVKFALMENNGTVKMKDKFPTTAKSAEELVAQMVEKRRPIGRSEGHSCELSGSGRYGKRRDLPRWLAIIYA